VDPRDALILAINNASTPPFGTLIKFDATTCTLTAPDPTTDRIIFDEAHGVDGARSQGSNPWPTQVMALGVSLPAHFPLDPIAHLRYKVHQFDPV